MAYVGKHPTPTRSWQPIGAAGHQIAALAIATGHLLAADSTPDQKGIYRANLTACQPGALAFAPLWVQESVYSLAANGAEVLAGTEAKEVFCASDGGTSWRGTNSNIEHRVRAVAIAGDTFYAGSEERSAGTDVTGVFKSTDRGANWQQIPNSPKDVAKMRTTADTLWLGTFGQCVWRMDTNTDSFTQRCDGLTTPLARTVRDIAIDESTGLTYLATSSGVYVGDGRTAWIPYGLDESRVRSLALVHNILYAGTEAGGAKSTRLLSSPAWRPIANFTGGIVRDLTYYPTHCHGLLAGTDDGIWILR